MFIKGATARWRYDRTKRLKTLSVMGPRRQGLLTTPGEFLPSLAVVPRPQGAVPFIHTDYSFNTFE
jgi:hypothetical protein